jgi:hypothetical protein
MGMTKEQVQMQTWTLAMLLKRCGGNVIFSKEEIDSLGQSGYIDGNYLSDGSYQVKLVEKVGG